MNTFMNISVSVSLAIHAIAYLASYSGKVIPAKEIAQYLDISEAHLHKVLKKLVKAGILSSLRGPGGGVTLRESEEDIRLIDVFEAVEGTIRNETCLLGKYKCHASRCIFGAVVGNVNSEVMAYLKDTNIKQLADVFQKQ